MATEGTDRDPVFSPEGGEVIFASDFSGIFNIYAVGLHTSTVRQLTNLPGGGLHPSVDFRGMVAFAAYGEDGYGIRRIDGREAPEIALPRFPPAPGYIDPSGVESTSEWESRPSGIAFLRAALLPRLVVDEGRLKLGIYAGGGDAMGRQNVFTGLAVAPANGDRDLFALYEYREWRPTLIVEFFHQRRYSSRGDSSAARSAVINGVKFNLNQLSVGLRGKLGRSAELSLSATYDRYDASVEYDAFVPRRDGRLGFERVEQKPFGYTYLNGIDLGLTYRLEALARRQDRDINPIGRRLYFRYSRLFNFFLEGFNDRASFIDEEYVGLFYNQFTLDWREYMGLPGNATLGLRFYGGWIDSEQVDDPELIGDFFDYRLGGLPFMKGYTFYSMEGRKAAMGNLTLRFPILPDVRRRILHLYLERVYGAVYGDMGKAWDGSVGDRDPVFGRKGPLRDVGGQLRCDILSYFGLPTRVQVDAAYGNRRGEGQESCGSSILPYCSAICNLFGEGAEMMRIWSVIALLGASAAGQAAADGLPSIFGESPHPLQRWALMRGVEGGSNGGSRSRCGRGGERQIRRSGVFSLRRGPGCRSVLHGRQEAGGGLLRGRGPALVEGLEQVAQRQRYRERVSRGGGPKLEPSGLPGVAGAALLAQLHHPRPALQY